MVEGVLISPAMLTRIAAHQAGGQTEADYGVPKGLTLRDEIARYFRIGQALFAALTAGDTPSIGATIKFVESLLREVFGFADLKQIGVRTIGDRQFAVTLEGGDGRVPAVIVPPADEIDRPSGHLPTDGRRVSAASAIQDWLNATDQSLWGFCSNGFRLRLVRDNASLTRPAYIEADLRALFQEENFADFTALWLLVHASRFGRPGTLPSDCALERWRAAGQKEGIAARDRLRDGVEAALLSFGNGFLAHPENEALRKKLSGGELSLNDFFSQLLRLVYRLIFLLAAEDRDLLHPPGVITTARKLYAEGYSLTGLRESAVRRGAWDRHHDRWEGLLITFAALARGEKQLGLPALDGLFAHGTLRDLENTKLANRSLMEAIYRLAWLKEDSGLVPVNWRDMETEELGSVYESLLELTPQLDGAGRHFKFAEGGEAKGHARKTTGSYYTPDSLVQVLLDSALDPVLDRVEAEAEDPAAALLSVTVLDPACGSGHFLLAAARRIATRLARARTHGLASPADFRHAMRDVARACIYGVDRNPMAVELTKVALWIETVEPGKPLGFLDPNIRCGDALLGVFDLTALEKGVPDTAYKPLTGDDKETAKHFENRNKAERDGQGSLDFAAGSGRLPAATPMVGEAKALRAMPENSPEEIALKRKRFEGARGDPHRWNLRIAADMYLAAFVTPKTGGVPANRNAVTIPTTAHLWDALAGRTVYGPLVGRAQDLAGTTRAFHWPLEFPDVMASGGFDVVLGNPPWDRIKLQEQEFFAARDPEIATAPNAAARGRLIMKLKEGALGTRERALHEEFEGAKRTAEASSVFVRVAVEDGGRFPLTGRGDVNTYALFAELFASLASKRGRAGVIVPTGIATDATTAPFFAALLKGKRLFSLYDFQTGMGYFDRIGHARFKFCLLTVGSKGTGSDRPRFSFFSRTELEFQDPRRHFVLSREAIAAINPNTVTAPVFRTSEDAELTAKIYARVPVLIDETKGKDGNPWRVSFMRTFDMSNDSSLFRTAAQLADGGFKREGGNWLPPVGQSRRQSALATAGGPDGASLALEGGSLRRNPERYVPLYEAKMIHQFDHCWATYDGTDSRTVTHTEKVDPAFEPTPRYWVPESEVADRLATKNWARNWLMGWRDIARATDERTVIAAAFPRVGVGNNLPLMFFDPSTEPAKLAALLGSLVSLTCDYFARHKVGGTHVNYFVYEQLPVLSPISYVPAELAFIVPRVLELTYTSHSMAPFARDLGYEGPPFAWNEDRRAQLRAELDACYARAYSLTRDELRFILDPAEVRGPDYPSETFRVLKKNEIAKYSEYRTARLVLSAWDRLVRGELTP
ncbi:Eco57I restriction-modification methylase domain-containing protein [Bradyrhizobium elkanii]|uniref:Eco57I restriction-modification methylase domain-containing protein n=1 Tax=Bradyrhizobium elkanii TaxID=29448 RepID=UPI001FDA9411|nr:N-6 DNA methylase [Bradyrhizobium elkanii]